MCSFSGCWERNCREHSRAGPGVECALVSLVETLWSFYAGPRRKRLLNSVGIFQRALARAPHSTSPPALVGVLSLRTNACCSQDSECLRSSGFAPLTSWDVHVRFFDIGKEHSAMCLLIIHRFLAYKWHVEIFVNIFKHLAVCISL